MSIHLFLMFLIAIRHYRAQIMQLLNVYPCSTTLLSRFVECSNIRGQIADSTRRTYSDVKFDESTVRHRIFKYSDSTESKLTSLLPTVNSQRHHLVISICGSAHDDGEEDQLCYVAASKLYTLYPRPIHTLKFFLTSSRHGRHRMLIETI